MKINKTKLFLALANAKMSKSELAKKAKISVITLQGDAWSAKVLGKVSDVLDVSPEYLLTEEVEHGTDK